MIEQIKKELVLDGKDPNDYDIKISINKASITPKKDFEVRQFIKGLEGENADLLFQNAMQDISIGTLQDENADLIFKVAMIEIGGM